MSSNLTPQAKAAYQAYLDASTLDERIEKLERFLSEVPKHKATEKIVALNKTRLSKLRQERETVEQRRKALAAGIADPFTIKRESQTIQLMLISDFFEGGQGVGKTTLLRNLTGITTASIGIFTFEPVVGIFDMKGVKIQIVEQPALHANQYLSRQIAGLRTTDIIALTIDLTKNIDTQITHILDILSANNIYLNREPPEIKIERCGSGGIQIFFLTKAAIESEKFRDFIKEIIKEAGMSNAIMKIYKQVSIEEIEMALNGKTAYKSGIIIATKADAPQTKQNYLHLLETYGPSTPYIFPIFPVAIKFSEVSGQEIRQGLDQFSETILQRLKLIKIYTKSKSGIAERPMIVPRDSTIGEIAQRIHKDFVETFKFAAVYRKELNKLEPIRIRAGLNFTVQENDVIELFSRI